MTTVIFRNFNKMKNLDLSYLKPSQILLSVDQSSTQSDQVE